MLYRKCYLDPLQVKFGTYYQSGRPYPKVPDKETVQFSNDDRLLSQTVQNKFRYKFISELIIKVDDPEK